MVFQRAVVVVAAGMALMAAPGVAQAAESYDCVTAEWARYRTGPGTGYAALGQAQRGQGVVKEVWRYADKPADGTRWWRVNLWGGAKDVWIRADLLGTCQR